MTHVANPYAQRLVILRDWKSRWFTRDKKQYKEFLRVDTMLREFLGKRLRGMYVGGVEIERSDQTLRIIISTSRPGVIIGRSGEGAQKLKKDVEKQLRKLKLTENPQVKIDIQEIRSPESNAQIVASMVIEGLQKRMPFRRVLKQTMGKVMANREVQGAKLQLSGMLGAASMSRKEYLSQGRVPLQTLRADVDYAQDIAKLPLGVIGVKVWIYKGEVFDAENSHPGRNK